MTIPHRNRGEAIHGYQGHDIGFVSRTQPIPTISFCQPLTIQNGATGRSRQKLTVRSARCENGEDAGSRNEVWRTCHGRGHPGVFPPEVRAQATALACSRPREKGVPLIRWSAAEIARRLMASGVVACISASTVERWLAQEKIRPWCYHTWQHILAPEAFLERARPILRLYERAQNLLQNGVWVVCTDEKTSIQARKAKSLGAK